jgi:hypothetical protein
MKDLVENGYEWPEALEREIDKSFARMQGPVADAGFKKLLEATPEEIAVNRPEFSGELSL